MTEPGGNMAKSGGLWDPHKLYLVSKEELAAIEQRKVMRAALKAEWQKKFTSPYGSPEAIFDPAMQRQLAMKYTRTRTENFVGAPKSVAFFFLIYVLPVGFLGTYYWNKRMQNEKKYRSGEITFKERKGYNRNRYFLS